MISVASLLRLRQGAPTRRVTLTAAGRVFDTWTAVSLDRDIADLAAGCTLEFYDRRRAEAAFPSTALRSMGWQTLKAGMKCSIALDGEEVLRGWIARYQSRIGAGEIACTATILDDAAHLVHCAAAPRGPVEYRNLTVLQFVQRLAEPHGLRVWSDVDLGDAFPLIGLDVADLGLAAIEKLCRQRELICTSDGVGGLVLTRGGTTPAPAPLRFGETMLTLEFTDDWTQRFSDYWVKGQGQGTAAARLDSTASPLGTGPVTPPPAATTVRPGVVMTGHARDEEITLYRPTVRASKTQSGGATVQQQADWMARVARGKGQEHTVTTADWRAGPERKLWRPNQLALVDDPFNDVLEERLIGAVSYQYGPEGAMAKLQVVRKGAYDLDPAVRERKRQRATGQAQDGTARPLRAS